MTPLFTIPQEMFFVSLTLLFFAAMVGDFRHAKIFRSYRNTPSPWKELSKDMRLFFFLLITFFTWAQNKEGMQSGGGEWLSGAALEAVESGYYDSLPDEETGISWALRTANPPFASNAVLTAAQFSGGFACVAVTAVQASALAAPSNAVTFSEWPYAVARQAALLPAGSLPEGFTFGGRPVTNLYMAASGMLSFDAPKSSPVPATDGIPDGTSLNYLAVFQTPSDIVPTNGLFWYAPGTDSSLFTWQNVYLGQDTNCLATVQAEFFANGDFTCRYLFPSSTNSYAALTNALLIGAQNNSSGETVLSTNSLPAVHPSFLPAFELRWKSLAALNPNVADHDTDSLATADELFIHRTDPRNPDGDGDGLTDGEEVLSFATDPNAFSSDGGGTGDLWRVTGGLLPSDAPWTNASPSAADGVLTVTTLLENAPAGGGAILRIGGRNIPVLPGTTLVSRIAVPRGATNLFILARGVNCDNASAKVTLEASSFTKISDPSGVFSGSFTLSPSRTDGFGYIMMPPYTVTPPVVCFHSPTSSVIRIVSADPDVWLSTAQGLVREYAPQVPSIPPDTFSNGLIRIELACSDVALATRASVTNVPAHFCNPDSGLNDEYPDGEYYSTWCKFENGVHVYAEGYGPTNCPCLVVTNAFECPCSGDGRRPCECAHAVRDPKAMPQDGSLTNVLGHAALVIGGTNDLLQVAVSEGTYRPCPLCACAGGVPSSASVYRQTSCIDVTPGTLTADGAFSVAGVSPSTNFADTVFIYKEADYSGPSAVIRYTRKDYTVLGTSVYPTDPGHSASNWFVACGMTNRLALKTDILLPTGNISLEVQGMFCLFVSNRVTYSCDMLVTNGQHIFVKNIADWRETYCDAAGRSQAYLVCPTSGVGKVEFGFEASYDSQPVSCSAAQDFTSLSFDSVDLMAAPFSGLVVVKGNALGMMASISPDSYIPPQGEPKWYFQQMNGDGTWGEWTSFGTVAGGLTYQHTTVTGGIFRVKAVLSDTGIQIERLYERTDDDAYSDLKKGCPDAFGVVDSQIQWTIRNTAINYLGSSYYAATNALPLWRDPRGLFSIGVLKCNVFVADMCEESGADVDPPVNGVYWSSPPSANNWAGMPDTQDPNAPYPIPDWVLLPLETKPQPGYVVASGFDNGINSGHCGIVDYDGRWISVGLVVNRQAKFDNKDYWRRYTSGSTNEPGLRVYVP